MTGGRHPRVADRPTVAGIVLAAGAGVRMGVPKSLLVDPDSGPWLQTASRVLRAAGLAPTVIVLGAEPRAADLLDGVTCSRAGDDSDECVVVAERWSEGIDASLAAALTHLARTTDPAQVSAAVVTLVDLRDLTAETVRRVVTAVGAEPSAVGRATYAGRPGHPVVLGRDHWEVAATDRRRLLASPAAQSVECADLAAGADIDHARDLPVGTTRLDPDSGRLVADLPPTNRR